MSIQDFDHVDEPGWQHRATRRAVTENKQMPNQVRANATGSCTKVHVPGPCTGLLVDWMFWAMS
jgi:hypothetical protein